MCVEDIGNTDKNNGQRTTATINSDIESTVVKNSGRPVFPGLSGTSRFPNVTGTLPPIDMSKTIPEVNVMILVICCGGVAMIAVIVISVCCVVRYKGKLKTNNNQCDVDTRIQLSATEMYNNEHLELGTQNEEYSEISSLQNANSSSAHHQVLDQNQQTNNYENKTATSNSGCDGDDHYAMTSEGVYDVTNNRRHKENDTIYSHAIDDVYDMSSSTRKTLPDDYDTYS